jgi:O-acetylhomoserine/O-acetylserine sulfhydrylase-like pyridoxal-dependent enzyme
LTWFLTIGRPRFSSCTRRFLTGSGGSLGGAIALADRKDFPWQVLSSHQEQANQATHQSGMNWKFSETSSCHPLQLENYFRLFTIISVR